jgi:tryptophan-rich sensory protein
MAEYAFQKSPRPGRTPGPSSPRGQTPQGHSSPWLALVGFIGLCLLVGVTAAAFNAPAMASWYGTLARPRGTPPDWLFGPVWTVLHITIGTSAWLVWWRAPQGRRQSAALQLWGWQLLLNAAWSPAFFGLHSPPAGLLVIVPMVVLISLTIVAFARLHRGAALLLGPYLVWTCYATYLNIGFWWLNH